MKKTLSSLFLAGLSILFSQACLAEDGRTDLDGPGDAEVIAGTGYEHTLFDSADQKCQHCHNDLYDTWKTSMHAKSWVDPIFMSKYQDFLRLQASKIGLEGPTGTYQVATIQKTSKVCVKCHAPTAYYSNDYEVKVAEVGDQNLDEDAYETAKALYETNLAGTTPAYDPALPATVVSMATTGKVYSISYHIGNSHNREGINCAYCHSIETVRMMNETDGDGGEYELAGAIKAGPIGPVVRYPGDVLYYSPFAHEPDMNAFFGLIGPEKYKDAGDTPKDEADFDVNKAADGRHTMKSIVTGCESYDAEGNCVGTSGYYTGGPFYGPFGVTGKSNSRDDDLADREALVNQHFVDAVEAADGDKFDSEHQFAAYGKSLCLSCHQRSSLALNPESNDIPGVQVGDDQFLELCSTWTAMSDGVGDNYQDTKTAPKCQRCHMEPLEGKTVLHQWDQPDTLFTLDDEPDLTKHFLPPSDGGTEGPVAEGYLNNHAFMGANTADFGLIKIQSGFESKMSVKVKKRRHGDDDDDEDEDEKDKKAKKGKDKKGKKLKVSTSLLNKTAHMFPGAHPMRRVLTRVVVTDADGNKIPYNSATGKSKFKSITNQLAVLEGDSILPGFENVKVKYDDDRSIVFQGQTPNLDEDGETVDSQFMDSTLVDWVSPDATVINSVPVYDSDTETWSIVGETTVKKITDINGSADHFTRIYGRETGKRMVDGTHVIRPGFDSNIAADNRMEPNEKELYSITYNIPKAAAWPLTVKYKVYYMKKGASGKFPTGSDGFLDTTLPAATLKKLAIYEVYSQEKTIK